MQQRTILPPPLSPSFIPLAAPHLPVSVQVQLLHEYGSLRGFQIVAQQAQALTHLACTHDTAEAVQPFTEAHTG